MSMFVSDQYSRIFYQVRTVKIRTDSGQALVVLIDPLLQLPRKNMAFLSLLSFYFVIKAVERRCVQFDHLTQCIKSVQGSVRDVN